MVVRELFYVGEPEPLRALRKLLIRRGYFRGAGNNGP